jgi:hypothetical protein
MIVLSPDALAVAIGRSAKTRMSLLIRASLHSLSQASHSDLHAMPISMIADLPPSLDV